MLRVPLTDFTAAVAYLDGSQTLYRVADREALKAFVAEHAFSVSAFGEGADVTADTITEWIDLLMELAAKKRAGIAVARSRRSRTG